MTVPPITISPGITNLITNPVAATDTTGWSAGTSITLSQTDTLPTTDGLPDGVTTGFVASADSALANSTNTGAFTDLILPAAGSYTITWYVYIPSTWTGGTIRVRQASFTGTTGHTARALDMDSLDVWQRSPDLTFVAASGDLVGITRIESVNTWGEAEQVYFTAVQAEGGEASSPFTIGTRPGSGTPGFLVPGRRITPLTPH